jgi:hypothetical protein
VQLQQVAMNPIVNSIEAMRDVDGACLPQTPTDATLNVGVSRPAQRDQPAGDESPNSGFLRAQLLSQLLLLLKGVGQSPVLQ